MGKKFITAFCPGYFAEEETFAGVSKTNTPSSPVHPEAIRKGLSENGYVCCSWSLWAWTSFKYVKGSGKIPHYSYYLDPVDAWLDVLEHVSDRSLYVDEKRANANKDAEAYVATAKGKKKK